MVPTLKPIQKSVAKAATVIGLGILILFCAGCAASCPASAPPETASGLLASMIRFYQGPLDHLAAVRMGSCPMAPSCSEFALAAMEKHGLILGWVMTCDRLLRCGGDETRLSSEVWTPGGFKTADALEQNDFWWDASPDGLPPTNFFPAPHAGEWNVFIE